ncbi:MAG: LysR substrate-binding domain-containing protein [Sphingomonadales bacterium]|nr:LysR substrate-binding domain-containing protein [Sphingomonadales bacterium]
MIFLPTLKQLRYLVALRDHLHFGRAAEACNVTQSTLSAGIQELENLLDTILVERTKRSVLFTPLGERVVEKARVVLREAEGLAELTRAAKAPLCGELRMGVIPTIAPFFLPYVLPNLRKAYPELKLYLKEDLSGVVCDDLLRGRLDVVLYALPYNCGNAVEVPLFDDPFYAAFRTEDFPDAPASWDPEDLPAERLLLLEEGHCLRDHALAACSLPGLKADRSILGTSLHTLVQMVDNGLGMTLLPKMAVDRGILDGTDIQTCPLGGAAPFRTIGLIWRRHSPRQDEYEILAEFLKSQSVG